MRIPFLKEQILDRVRFENPWWDKSKIEPHYSGMRKREYFKLFMPLVTEKAIKRAVVLMGARRVGKTVLIFHTIQALIESGISAKSICYFSVETPIYNGIGLNELVQYYFEASGINKEDESYIFFDEIQYLKGWEVDLKSLVDSYHKIKFVVSGSAAAALKLKSNESGAGRFTDFILPPLTFHEYLSLKNLDGLVIAEEDNITSITMKHKVYNHRTENIQELNKHFIDYINFGGYPEVSLSREMQADPGRYIRNDIIDKVLMRDLPLLYGIEDIQELNSLFTYIAYHSGSEMSLDAISQSSGVSKNTIKKYITYLESAFLIRVIQRIDNSGKRFKRANFFKIYLTNPSLRCALFTPVKSDDPFIGNLVETAIYSQWQHTNQSLYYARWDKGEIDIVTLGSNQKPYWVVEIKWSNKHLHPSHYDELNNVKEFCTNHKISLPRVTTLDITAIIEIEGMKYDFTACSLYCYIVGKNIVLWKINPLVLNAPTVTQKTLNLFNEEEDENSKSEKI